MMLSGLVNSLMPLLKRFKAESASLVSAVAEMKADIVRMQTSIDRLGNEVVSVRGGLGKIKTIVTELGESCAGSKRDLKFLEKWVIAIESNQNSGGNLSAISSSCAQAQVLGPVMSVAAVSVTCGATPGPSVVGDVAENPTMTAAELDDLFKNF